MAEYKPDKLRRLIAAARKRRDAAWRRVKRNIKIMEVAEANSARWEKALADKEARADFNDALNISKETK
jgi:hypothetical protein